MAGKFLVSAGAIALLAAASTGTAQAADIIPVVVPVVTPVVVVPVGPTVAIKVETSLNVDYDGNFDAWANGLLDLKITSASGWGFQLVAGGNQYVVAPIEFYGGAQARVFRAIGPVEIGVFAGANLNPGITGNNYYFGGDFTYETDRVEVETYVAAQYFLGGTVRLIAAGAEATVHVTDRLDVIAGVERNLLFGSVDIEGRVELDLGAVTPFAGVIYNPSLGVIGQVGVELEKQLGTGPLSLIGYGRADFGVFGPSVAVGLGIRFSRGDIDD